MLTPADLSSNSHLTFAPRPRMFRASWQRWAWSAVPLVSIATFAFLPFIVAWRRRVVPGWAAGLYTLGSAFWWTVAIVKPDDHTTLLTWTLRTFIAVATVHVLLLDPIKRQAK